MIESFVVCILIGIFASKSFLLYKKFNQHIFFDLNFVFTGLLYLYIGVPIIFYSLLGDIFQNTNVATINLTNFTGLYFLTVSTLLFCTKGTIKKYSPIISCNIKITKLALLSINLILIILIYLNFDELIAITNKSMGAELALIFDALKVKALFTIAVCLSIMLCIATKSIYNLSYLTIFVGLDLYLRNRFFLLTFIFSLMIVLFIVRKKINLKFISILLVLMVLVAIFRDNNETDYFDHLILIIGELLFTWQSTFIIANSSFGVNFLDWFLNLISGNLFEIINSHSFNSYKQILDQSNEIGFGLGGSLLAEIISFNNITVTTLSPFFLFIYLLLFEKLKTKNTFFLISHTVLMVNMITILRGDFSKIIFYNLYIAFLLLPFYHVQKFKSKNR